jgi:transposase
MKDELTMVHVPAESEERVRDLIRGRSFLQKQRKCLKQYILSQCRRAGLHYKQELGSTKSHWTQTHEKWLEAKINKSGAELQYTLRSLLFQVESLREQISGYDEEIERIGRAQAYQERVKALICYRGIGKLTAMTIITELGDIRRFGHPRRVTSYAGLDLREYSSGGKEKRYAITKMGNSHIRRSVVEACQSVFKQPCLSRRLKADRAGVEAQYIAIADRCMRRLYKKSHRLLHAGKNRNVVKVACARELLSFVWESLNEAA